MPSYPLKKKVRVGLFGLVSVLALTGIASVGAQAAEEKIVQEPGLKPYVIVDNHAIPESLSGKPGDPVNGKALFVHRKKGNCLTCHVAPIPEQDFHGTVGPDLHGVGARMSVPELRLRVVNPKVVNPDTIMMAYYRTWGLTQVKKEFVNKPMLSEQEIEDVVAYLATLK